MANSLKSKPRAVILLSGGLDSATTLAIAKQQGYACYALSFNYGQRSISELSSAKKISQYYNVEAHKILNFNLGMFGGSALTDTKIDIPEEHIEGIPVTYVPARNTIFLSMALGWAEVLGARDLFVGVNSVDYSGYPDCRPEFVQAFENLANLATKAGVEGKKFQIRAPLIQLTKSEIIQKGIQLGVPYADTLSCYQADEQGLACGHCDSCGLRKQGFIEAGIKDPTIYF